ncbi:hypothetical protein D3C71_78480 [compost metagenome]
MKRRSFLAGILAAGVAPAIVHNPMKIFVPKQEIDIASFYPKELGRGFTSSIFHIDEAPYQDEFGEAFFRTVVIEPDENGIGGLVDFRRNADDFDRIVKDNIAMAERLAERKRIIQRLVPGDQPKRFAKSIAKSMRVGSGRPWLA